MKDNMATVCEKSLYHSKILEAINHVQNISKKKSTTESVHKYLVKDQLMLEKVLLQASLDDLVEENKYMRVIATKYVTM